MDTLLPASSASLPTLALDNSRRKRFDDRSQTQISVQLKARYAAPLKPPKLDFEHTPPNAHLVKWTETKSISRVTNSQDVLAQFGQPCLIDLSPLHIAVGTQKGYIVGFSYKQEVSFVLAVSQQTQDGTLLLPDSPVTCTAFSSDALFFAAGYMDGKVVVWDLTAASTKAGGYTLVQPYDVIYPITMEARFAKNALGHLINVPVNSVCFVGDLHHHLVSSDLSGLVFFHYGFKKFLRKYYISQKLLGQNDTNSSDPSGKFSIQDCQILPIGTSPQITDQIGLLAVMTSNILVVVSVRSLNNVNSIYPKTHFKISKSKLVHSLSAASRGCLTWYPCIKVPNTNRTLNAKLAYAWNNVLTILEVDNGAILSNIYSAIADAKDKDKCIPTLPIYKTARWLSHNATDLILSLKWLNSEMLTAMVQDVTTTQTKLHFFYYQSQKGESKLVEVGLDDMDSQQVSSTTFVPPAKNTTNVAIPYINSFSSSFRIFRHRLVMLVNSHSECEKKIVSGRCLKWADRLLECVAQENILSALLTAKDYYSSTNHGHLVLCGLPHTTAERHTVVEPFLVRIMEESVNHVFGEDQENQAQVLHLYLQIISLLTKDRGGPVKSDLLDILEAVYEVYGNTKEYFSILEEYILSRQISNLSPLLFIGLVEYFVQIDNGAKLTEIVCVLDSTALNIDATLQLCEIYQLRECMAFIWNECLGDFLTPLVKFIEDLELAELDHDQKCIVFLYLSYILGGRKFPTDEYLDFEVESKARDSICGVLFSLGPVRWPPSSDQILLESKSDSVFPYLNNFLKFDLFETLTMLNEFFENSCLNSDVGITRQYVIDALIDIFEVSSDDFSNIDRVHLAVFVARNYPKYFQFIRLSESFLQETVQALCSVENDEFFHDRELALESLLPVYDFSGDDYLLQQIRLAGFSNVLYGIYKSDKKYSKALKIWFENQRSAESTDSDKTMEVLADILKSTFASKNKVTVEQAQLAESIEKHFDSLIAKNPEVMVQLANNYNRELHTHVLNSKDESSAYQYLRAYFESEAANDSGDKISAKLLTKFVQYESLIAPESIVETIVRHNHVLSRDVAEKDELMENLKRDGHVEALAVILKADGQYERALREVTEALGTKTKGHDVVSAQKLLDSALSVCEGGTDGELYGDLAKTLVQLTNEATEETKGMLNQGVYQCFRHFLDRDKGNSTHTSFTRVLDGVMESATLANVRGILQEILTSFYFETEMYHITLGKVNQGIYKSLYRQKTEALRGWLIIDRPCTSCGKVMVGDGIPERNFDAYEDRERSKIHFGSYDKDEYKECGLVLFKCQHGYHVKCLENLGSMGSCVVCTGQ